MVAGNCSKKVSVTGRPSRMEFPKSSCSSCCTYSQYCSRSGWADPDRPLVSSMPPGGAGVPEARRQQLLHVQPVLLEERLVEPVQPVDLLDPLRCGPLPQQGA